MGGKAGAVLDARRHVERDYHDAVLVLDDARPPVPPADLMLRVIPAFDVDDVEAARWSFDIEGLNNLRFFERALAAVSLWHFGGDVWLSDPRLGVPQSFGDFERLLDFGCGCGRFVRHMRPLASSVEIHGTDVDAEMIDWLQRNVSYGHFLHGCHEPPLDYSDHFFDLVLSHSVFSHLDETMQDLWLGELQRITRPGGWLLPTVEGPSTWARMRAAADPVDARRWEHELGTRGILFIRHDAWVGSTHPEFYHSCVHAPWYILDHWSRFFDVEAYLPDGSWSQDLVVLKRREDGAPPSRPVIGNSRSARTLARDHDDEWPFRSAGHSRAFSALTWLRGRRNATGPAVDSAQQIAREIEMLRAGLYEQGRRISVLGVELRDELRRLAQERSDPAGEGMNDLR